VPFSHPSLGLCVFFLCFFVFFLPFTLGTGLARTGTDTEKELGVESPVEAAKRYTEIHAPARPPSTTLACVFSFFLSH